MNSRDLGSRDIISYKSYTITIIMLSNLTYVYNTTLPTWCGSLRPKELLKVTETPGTFIGLSLMDKLHFQYIVSTAEPKAIEKIQKVRRSLKRSSRRVKSNLMMREDSQGTEEAMDTQDMNHTAPLATLATTPIEEDIIFESRGQKKRGGTFPRMAHFDIPEDTPPGSQNGTLKANGTRRPQRQNGSLKGPWNRKNRGKGVPVVKEDTAKVLEMYLKRRSKSLNDAVLTREYFAQEKKKRGRSARNNTVSICSTLSTDSTTSEVHVHATVTAQTSSDVDTTVFSRASKTQQSFHEAMKCSIMEEGSAMEQSADDELSSSDEQSPRSRSAPSTLRMQVNQDPKEGMGTLKLKDLENGTATLTRDGYKRDSKKEPRRKRSFLDKAKNVLRSPSTSRKIIRTPSAVQRQEEKEKERLKEEKEKEKERLKEEKEREKEKQRKEKEDKEQLDKKLKEYKEREKEKLKEMERRRKEEKEREKEWEKERERLKKEREKKEKEKEEMDRSHTRHHARTEVHSEMKKTGFTARLKRSFRRSSRDHHRTKDHTKPPELPPRPPELQQPKDVKPKRWPSFQFKRKPRKSASTPTDDSGAGATTPSDTASMDFEYFASRTDHTRSLNDAERRRLIIEMRQSRQENSGNASDSQVLDRVPGAHPPLSQATSHDSFGSFASSEGSERPERPRTLAFRRTRAERAQRGLNNVIRLDSTTPGHVRRDVDTSFPVLPAAMTADDLVQDGGSASLPDRGASEGTGGGDQNGADRNVTDSWTESGDGSDIPFEQRNQAEREEYFKRIADRLAMIGDQALAEYEFNDGAAGAAAGGQQRAIQSTCTAETYASCSVAAGGAIATGISHTHAAEYMEIGQRIQTDIDGMQLRRRSLAYFPAGMVMGVIMNDTYQSFCNAMQSIVGQDVGMEQLAMVFKFTKVAVKAAHSMGKHASSIKDNSVRFISDRFAVWLDSQGGWGSVVTSDDSDSLHEESEID